MAMVGITGLNAPLSALRDQAIGPRALTGSALAPGLWLDIDPAAGITASWASPRARLIELETRVTTPGAWLALHIALPPLDLRKVAWLGYAAQSAAAAALTVRVALRSGIGTARPGGGPSFCDAFFDRELLSQPGGGSHHDMLAPACRPDLPPRAPWRQLVLFLPSGHDITWALHDLRLMQA